MKITALAGRNGSGKTLYVEQLRRKLKHDTARDLDYNRQTLKHMLESEIIACYYFQRGVIEHSLDWDPVMREALRLLGNQAEYDAILGH